MNKETSPSEIAITEIADALKKVLSVKPQLLFKALERCGSDYMLDHLKDDLTDKERAAKAYVLRGALCLAMARILLNSGAASLDQDDMTNIAMYLRSSK